MLNLSRKNLIGYFIESLLIVFVVSPVAQLMSRVNPNKMSTDSVNPKNVSLVVNPKRQPDVQTNVLLKRLTKRQSHFKQKKLVLEIMCNPGT